ncbi:MAG: glycosyltransferase [Proteobacteria bacterium]|nr:glycosyltransferase [Pseudomonadota bacterium]
MRSALVLSRFFPFNSTRVHAVYQRLGTQVAALSRVADTVRCLFLVPPDQGRTAEQLALDESRLKRLWAPNITVELSATADESTPAGAWARFGSGVFDFQSTQIARPTANNQTRTTVRRALDGAPDLILVHRLSAMSVLLEAGAGTHTPLYFDLDDLEHVAWARRLVHDPGWKGERLLLLQTPQILRAELKALALAQTTFVCSQQDQLRLRRWAPQRPIEVVPNSVEFPPVDDTASTEPLVAFIGSMGSRPNAQAVDRLVQDIWPLVMKEVPEARLAIIGGAPENTRASRAHPPSVTFTGFVDDLEPWYRKARVVCCPIFHGSGTRVKIIEAAARARAIVSTPLGAEGLDFKDKEDILLGTSPADLAERTCRLLNNPVAAAELGRRARARAAVLYDRQAIIERLTALFRGRTP